MFNFWLRAARQVGMSHQMELKENRVALARPLPAPLPESRSRPARAPAQPSASHTNLAWLAVWMTGTLLSFTVSAVSVRELASSLNPFEMMSLRSAGGLLILTVLLFVRPSLRDGLVWRRMNLHAFRSTIHFVSQISWTFAITMLPLATVFALEFTMPVWVAVLAVIFLGERLTTSRVGSIVLCFVGVLVIVRPGLAFQPGSLVALVAAVAMAITAIFTKKLTATETTFAILFWMNLMQLPMNLAGSHPAFILNLHAAMILPIVGIIVGGLLVHFCLTNAFRCGDASLVIPLDFLRVPFIALIGWWFYGEALDAFVFIGAGFIILGVLWNVQAEARRRQPALAEPVEA
jgi:drug/metabolite transporter (DMT)-like permease